MYTVSGSIAPYSQSTFDAYVDDTYQWLDKTRVFHGAGYDAEMAAVSLIASSLKAPMVKVSCWYMG
ncbi:hypothetical protein JCM19235_313 [Vibrio maritimus]|uniref:Uncharacterized protein n=1 Tax=Vibrio maritimus TaxID=990268 RepID=A0A090S2N2_9VIBR|nr:hypothetical protein JCM19235_313 [Vibrio maritimus]